MNSKDRASRVCINGTGPISVTRYACNDLEKLISQEIDEAVREALQMPMHSSSPEGMKCSDCTIDKEPCPRCYSVWWEKRHPNTSFV